MEGTAKHMAKSPPIWSSNWMNNYERLQEWSNAVVLACNMSDKDYNAFCARRAVDMTEPMQEAVTRWGANFACLLEWIECGVQKTREEKDVELHVPTVKLHAHEKAWLEHIAGNRRDLSELSRALGVALSNIRQRQERYMQDDSSGSYSSWGSSSGSEESDETETTSSS